jgi:2,3-dihydroxy-p-cumate/2,3-dihydroxybenzoate 3,4-dioxygenase
MPATDFRYRKMGYVALDVTDIDKSTAFAIDVFGLDMSGEGPNGERFFRASTGQQDVVLAPAKTANFNRSSWELETNADLDRAFAHYTRLGLDPKWVGEDQAHVLGLERAFRVHDPVYGVCWEYFAKMRYISTPRTNHLTSFYGQGHFGLNYPNVKKMSDYMVDNMGFLLSDYVDNWFGVLLRAFPNPNHHSFAPLFSPSGKLTFHHIAFMVNSIDDIGKLFNRIKLFDVKTQFGIGRHPTSGSIHLYIYDPDYFIWEYTLGMEQFPETGAREARRMSSNPSDLDLWGAVPDKEYAGRNPGVLTEAAALSDAA